MRRIWAHIWAHGKITLLPIGLNFIIYLILSNLDTDIYLGVLAQALICPWSDRGHGSEALRKDRSDCFVLMTAEESSK